MNMANADGLVRFNGVWKKFHRGEFHDSLRDLIPALARRLIGKKRPRSDLHGNDFWALKDVSFEVRPGEALGIIGPNGAGKSTVLKILTKILRPNRGSSVVQGRAGALIEVAAGFHPDLTGRENIFLQGAVMGMSRRETEQKFDRIVDFAGIDEFIDTQVKRYSTGMNARLGFAIAAHLDPDVLIIDEVLSVGDQKFQEKAFDRMREIVKSDIPVVVVSHQLERVADLCSSAILLDRGEVAMRGDPAECIAQYVGAVSNESRQEPDSPVLLHRLEMDGVGKITSGDRFGFELQGSLATEVDSTRYGIGMRFRALHTGEVLFVGGTDRLGLKLPPPGEFRLKGSMQANVPPGVYSLESGIWDKRRSESVAMGPSVGITVGAAGNSFWGKVQLNLRMEFEEVEEHLSA